MNNNVLEVLEQLVTEVRGLKEAVQEQTTAARGMMTIEEAAKYLHLSRPRVYSLAYTRELSYYRNPGRALWFDRNDLDEYLQRQRVPSETEVRNLPYNRKKTQQ